MSKQREPVRFLVFSASLRAGSLNTTLAKLAASVIERHGGSVDLTGMSALGGPSYSQDAQTRDGVSRFRPQPFNGKHALLLSASPSMAGGNRGLWALRVPLEHLGSRVYPDMFSLAQAHQAFDPQGKIANPQLADRLDQTIAGFMDLAEAAKHYPCAKAAWIEFLGEHPDSPIDRVDKPPQS